MWIGIETVGSNILGNVPWSHVKFLDYLKGPDHNSVAVQNTVFFFLRDLIEWTACREQW